MAVVAVVGRVVEMVVAMATAVVAVVDCQRRHDTTRHDMTLHHATPRHATPQHHTTPRHATPRHTTPRYTTPHHTTLHHTTPHHTTPHQVLYTDTPAPIWRATAPRLMVFFKPDVVTTR